MDDFYIRVDGNEIIATGHVMRCITIAQQLQKMGVNPIFILADSYPSEIIKNYGFEFTVLDSKWDDLDTEIEKISRFIEEREISSMLIDSYYVTPAYLEAVSAHTKVIYIDDIQKFAYPVDAIIHYNAFVEADSYKAAVSKDCNISFLLGGRYAPLREEFFYQAYKVRDEVKKVLITTGGTDKYNVAGHLLDLLREKSDFNNVEYHVVSGIFNINADYLKKLAAEQPNIYLHENAHNMSELMRMCDVAISAAGTTLYELCACGIPTICFTIADNQRSAKKWQNAGIMYYAGNVEESIDDCVDNCYIGLKEYMADKSIRMDYSKKMQSMVDGYGAKRIAEYICKSI